MWTFPCPGIRVLLLLHCSYFIFISQALINSAQTSSIASKWLSICTKLQDPELYDASAWTRAISIQGEQVVAVADNNEFIQAGDILSLYPVHAVGYRVENKDYVICNSEAFVKDRSYRLDLDMQHSSCYEHSLFIEVDPTQPHVAGWMGHLPRHQPKTSKSNCCILPLSSSTPLFALVATGPIRSGQPLVLHQPQSFDETSLSQTMEQRHAGEIRELVTYLNMAFPTAMEQGETPTATDSSNTLQHPFQRINRSYKGLTHIYKEPDILVIPDFLSTSECDRIISKVQPHLIPCLVKNPTTGQVESDTATRTSSNANVPQREVPTLVQKLTQLLDCSKDQLEILQVLKYERGQYFRAHTDGFDGPTTACGFANSGRLVTVFCYLNHVPQGGQTRFPGLDLDIVPQQGMAVLHFPTTLGLEEDTRTEHEGLPAVDDKWLLVTWMWMHERSDAQYAESLLPDLNQDII